MSLTTNYFSILTGHLLRSPPSISIDVQSHDCFKAGDLSKLAIDVRADAGQGSGSGRPFPDGLRLSATSGGGRGG